MSALPDLFLCPDEGLSLVVICVDVGIDVLLELFEAREGGAAERLALQDREPYLDLIEPGRACRREMELHVGVGLARSIEGMQCRLRVNNGPDGS